MGPAEGGGAPSESPLRLRAVSEASSLPRWLSLGTPGPGYAALPPPAPAPVVQTEDSGWEREGLAEAERKATGPE